MMTNIMIRFFLVMVCLTLWALMTGCARTAPIDLLMTYNNISDSYIYPYRIAVNGRAGIPASLASCSQGEGAGGTMMTTVRQPPRYVIVEWEHLVSRRVYRARIPLTDRSGAWWRRSPFQDRKPVLVIQFRGNQKVAAMIVADYYDFSRGRIELGEAVGVEIPRPKGGPGLYLTYEDMVAMRRQRRYVSYKPGSVVSYERQYDGQLSPAQRYGCPRRPDGRIDVQRLPDKKLPLLTDLNGQWIACEAYYCEDKSALKKKLFQHDFRYYPPGRYPAYRFKNAPNPKPAW